MAFELLLASRRMITQSRETDRTHRDERRVVDSTTPLDFTVRGIDATDRDVAGSPAGSTDGATDGGNSIGAGGATFGEGIELSALATTVGGAGASCLTVSAAVSVTCCARSARGALERTGFASDVRLPISHTPPTTAANPAATPRHTFGPIGGRSGFV